MCVKIDACVFEFVLTRQSTELLFERLQDHLCDLNRTVFWFDDDTVMKLRGKTVSIGDEFVCWTDVSYMYDDNMRKAKIVFYDEYEESLVIDVSVRVGLNVDVYMSEEKRDDVMSEDLWIGKYGIMFEEFDRSKMDEVIYYIQSIPGVHSVYTCKTDKTWGMECADLGVIAKGEEVLERVTFFVDRLDYIYDICPVSFTRYSVCENSGCEESVECGLDGHREAYRFGFGRVLDELEKGNRCMRDGWNGKDMYITLKRPNLFSDMTVPYIYMKTVQGDYVPWLASQSDLLSEDWGLYRYE